MIKYLYSLTILFLLCTTVHSATTTVLPRLPEADTLDTEVSTNKTIMLTHNQLEVILELDATATNNVEVAFGMDANNNGVLDTEEETCALGWDCGAWFLTDKITGETIISKRESGYKKLVTTFDFTVNGTLRKLTATDGASILNQDFKVPRTIMSQKTNLMRLTARGKGQHLEHLKATNKQIGIAFIIR